MVVFIFIAYQSDMYTSGINLFALILLIFVYGYGLRAGRQSCLRNEEARTP